MLFIYWSSPLPFGKLLIIGEDETVEVTFTVMVIKVTVNLFHQAYGKNVSSLMTVDRAPKF
jgi:hypothetical protein